MPLIGALSISRSPGFVRATAGVLIELCLATSIAMASHRRPDILALLEAYESHLANADLADWELMC